MALQTARELQPYILPDVQRTGKKLGCGSFGCVEELIHAGALCAGKVIHDTLIDSKQIGVRSMVKKFETECQILSGLRHPSIVQFLGICIVKDNRVPVLVMECLEASLDRLLDQGKTLAISIKTSILLDVTKGLVYLHSHSPPVIHRDLTARNVLLTSAMQAKIADLGNARIVESQTLTKTLSTAPGTLVYMPPEAMAHPPQYDEKLAILHSMLLFRNFPASSWLVYTLIPLIQTEHVQETKLSVEVVTLEVCAHLMVQTTPSLRQ